MKNGFHSLITGSYNCENEKIIGRETIQQAIEKLPITFVQTHKSFIVNLDKIRRYDSNTIFIDKKEIPIGDRFSEATTNSY
jgi:DNA-binding LytR/AlgR family response regulator